ncbi:MAG: glycyl-radical enzyme activating protein [Myxococcales bacterium]|nr:glycyl-radical enzyme activating protein [Myxococcales bacterium]
MNGIVFDLQYNALHDGPGIRTLIFLKGCPLDCAWCHNPESKALGLEMAFCRDRCVACGRCVEVCPRQAVHLHDKTIHRLADRCTVCGECAAACQQKALEKIGREISAAAVVEAARRDRPFYEQSGGGATFSGGEPTIQLDFLLAAAQALRADGIHVALETCGLFPAARRADLAAAIDLFLFDLKLIDDGAHRRWTGSPNEKILENFAWLAAALPPERLWARLPVIPGVTDTPAALRQLVEYLQWTGFRGPVHLMPYNRLAKNKWEKMGRGDDYRDFGELAPAALAAVAKRFAAAGFAVTVSE